MDAETPPESTAGSENFLYAREIAEWKVKSGFWRFRDIITDITDLIQDEHSEMTPMDARAKAKEIVQPLWATQLRAQATWPDNEDTVCEKLESAFDSLEHEQKILARMNYTCCRTCGVAEIGGDSDENTQGYVFFHEQGTERLVSCGRILLYFGSFTDSESKNEAIGKAIVGSLRSGGLSVEWSGDPTTAIEVNCGEWRRHLDSDEEDDESEDGKEGDDEE
ncbi:uncharacterized protein N7458_010524 [Penicillium daleae]|uniref:DUF6891 domain-containing protein n=1 Tax=Penicillium daleae TaxID=63821 RepID=A0AAD6G052_9EURO|nr:uncharacterized protein N7458_010524 [Penicillium daleae]KAJ5439526.1 hypothetical protein N7458_010524 [Penicillium daleae]